MRVQIFKDAYVLRGWAYGGWHWRCTCPVMTIVKPTHAEALAAALAHLRDHHAPKAYLTRDAVYAEED